MTPITLTWHPDSDGFPDSYTIFYKTNLGINTTITVSGTSTAYNFNVINGSILHLEIWSVKNKVESKHVSFDFSVP